MIGSPAQCIAYLFDQKDGDYEVKRYYPKRSNQANAYYWKLVELITEERRKDDPQATETETHRELLADYGTRKRNEQGELIFHTFIYGKEPTEGYYTRPLANVTLTGQNSGVEDGFIVAEIKGSHEYDSKEMKALLDGTIQEAQSLGIETKTPAEIEEMTRLLDEKHHTE